MARAIITGLGVATAVGFDLATYWNGLLSGVNCFAEARKLPGSGILVGEIDPAIGLDDLPIATPGMCDRSTMLAVSAARSALRDAGLDGAFENPTRVAVVIGNGGGGLVSLEEQYDRIYKQRKRVHPFSVVRIMVSSSASWVSMAFGTQGPCFVTSSACASATQAIGTAAALLRAGVADVAIAGGTEAPLTEGTLLAWDAMKVMSRSRCRPFSRNRDGLMLAEGAGMLVMETEAHARRRGINPQIEIAGFMSNADAGDIVAPSSEGMVRVMKGALDDAGLAPRDVCYVNAHGTGTAANDIAESSAMVTLFGKHRTPPASSIKGVTGHSLGAAGALEAVATVLAMRNSVAPPTANFDEPDPDCDIDVIPNEPRAMPIEVALSNSFAFGGLNASIAFRRSS